MTDTAICKCGSDYQWLFWDGPQHCVSVWCDGCDTEGPKIRYKTRKGREDIIEAAAIKAWGRYVGGDNGN